MVDVEIRCEGGDFLTFAIIGRSHPGCSDYWDGNWVCASVKACVGGFRATVNGNLRADELAAFAEQMTLLQSSLIGTVKFVTMEDWFSIQVTGDGRGHMEYHCVLRDQPGIGNTLEFVLRTDQTFTRTTVSQLADVVREFPVIGRNEAG